MQESKKEQKKKASIISAYANFHKANSHVPTMRELVQYSTFTKDSIKHYFSSLSELDSIARKTHPDMFFDIDISDLLSKRAIKELRSKIKKHKKFVVTTAVTGCTVDINFYESIKNYCTKNKALLLVLVASDPAHNKDRGGYGSIDEKLSSEAIVFEDTELNSNLFLNTIKLSAKHIDPITGLDRIGQRSGTFVFASPKQRLHMVATSNVKLPHALMTTGAITLPNYVTDLYMSERTAYIARNDHIMGALILEIKNDNEYHYRQIQSSNDGSFIDLGNRYFPNGEVEFQTPSAIVLGDWHAGSTDPMVIKCTEEMLNQLKPANIVLHDAFDGLSINHHEDGNQISLAQKVLFGKASLEGEMERLASDIEHFLSFKATVYIIKSNHDEFLCKYYLQHGKYTEDPHNHRYALPLASAMLDGLDPLKFAVENKFKNSKSSSLVKWLKRDDDFLIAGIQLGAHGDKGPNGSRGSLQNMEKAYGNSITGHSHTPGILRGAWAVGTSSFLKLNYNHGPSSWLHTHCLVYEDGSRQLINMIDGKWRA